MSMPIRDASRGAGRNIEPETADGCVGHCARPHLRWRDERITRYPHSIPAFSRSVSTIDVNYALIARW